MHVIDVCQLFMSLKTHFKSPKYDWFRYNGKVNIGDFNSRKDKYQFQKLARMYEDLPTMRDFIVANIVYSDNDIWIGNLFEPEAKDRYLKFLKAKESFTYLFKSEVEDLMDMDDWKSLIKCPNGQDSKLLKRLYSSDISLETFTVLNRYLQFFDYFNRHLDDDIVWPKLRLKAEKYLPFISYDNKQVIKILKDNLK